MKRIAVLCSGNGSNLQAIIDAVKDGALRAQISLVVSDRPQAQALTRARTAGIKTFVVPKNGHSSRESFDEAILEQLAAERVEAVVLAGYMRILTPGFIARYRQRIINIHPALLPSFKGAHGARDALAHGVKITGVSVHLVTDELDDGPIVMQRALEVRPDDTEQTLLERIHAAEHTLYPQAIQLLLDGRLQVEGRRVRIRETEGGERT